MNPLLRVFAAGSLLVATTAFAADAFEGQVSFTMNTGKGRTQEMDYTMKGSALRMDMSADGHEVSNIIDMKKREMLMLMHEQRMYMVMPMPNMPGAAPAESGPTPDIEKTGKTETILGYKCQQVLVKDKGKVTELWLADGLGMFMGMGGGNPMMGGGPRGGGASKWEAALKGIGGFPLRVISRDASSKETFKMEATRITPGPQPDSEFAPPEGYQKFSMPNMGGMMPPRG
jgi:hypothetical protein